MTITRKAVSQIVDDINNALKTVSEKHGINLKAGRATYSDDSVVVKVEGFVVNDVQGSVGIEPGDEKFVVGLKELGSLYGLTPAHYGREFVVNGEKCTFVGINPKARKTPFIYRKGSKMYRAGDFILTLVKGA